MRTLRYGMALLLVMGILLSVYGCYVPDRFKAKLTVNMDGSYTFMYEGTLIDTDVHLVLNSNVEQKVKQSVLADAEKRFKSLGFKNVKYLGDARYESSFEKIGKPGEAYYFVSNDARWKMFTVQPPKDGTMIITAIQPSIKDTHELEIIKAKIEGTLTISVAEGLEVINHNAQGEPKIIGAFKEYTWEITSFMADPYIVIKSNMQ